MGCCAQRLSASPLMGIWILSWAASIRHLCSTPFGITANGNLRDEPHTIFQHMGAQRLSASPLMGILCSAQHRQGVGGCSTPFGITANGNSSNSTRLFRPEKCSTPFGITANGNLTNFDRCHILRACSTPFGITANGNRRATRSGAALSIGAQRLSASPLMGIAIVCTKTVSDVCAQRLSASPLMGIRSCCSLERS